MPTEHDTTRLHEAMFRTYREMFMDITDNDIDALPKNHHMVYNSPIIYLKK